MEGLREMDNLSIQQVSGCIGQVEELASLLWCWISFVMLCCVLCTVQHVRAGIFHRYPDIPLSF